jgi:RNA polymerase sigma factor (sigma-70 family)
MTNLSASPALTEGRTCSLEAHTAHEAPVAPPRVGGRLLLARRTDERLVEMVRQGDAAAFEVLYDRYHLRILSFCRHMLGSQPDGEDATQHAFVALHRHITADDRPVDVKPWLFQVARNRCLSIIRGRREHADIDNPVVQPPTEGLADSVQRRSDLRELLGDLQELPDDQRAALLLSSLGDLSGDEIAEVVGCRPQKVKALVFQARASLMNERDARNTDCEVVREQLATLRGGALLRGPLRRHVRSCEGCRAFRAATRKQKEALALLLPVVPTAGLKAATMGAALGGSAAAGGAAATATGSGVLAGLATTGKAGAAKLLIATALAGGTVGAGVAEVKHLSNDPKPAAPVTRHHGQGAGTVHKSSKVVSGAAGTHVANGHNKGGATGTHGKPTTSPAASSHAATGKGIASTQHSGHGKTAAPGRLKTNTNHGKALANGKTNHATKTPSATAHRSPSTAPTPSSHVTTPSKPVAPPGQAKQQTQVDPVTTVTDETSGAVSGAKGNLKK